MEIDCACGCGEAIERKAGASQPKRFKRGHGKALLDRLATLACACGCGTLIKPLDSQFRPRTLAYGHGMDGQRNPMFGKPNGRKGVPRTGSEKASIAASRKGKPHPVTQTEARKRAILLAIAAAAKANKGKTPWNKGTTDQVYLEKMRQNRLRQKFPKKDSSIERKLQAALDAHRISYKKHVPIMGQPDLFLGADLCVFADGSYWHSLPKVVERDARVNARLAAEGYRIVRLGEDEINADVDACVAKIVEALVA